jgi:hypothetical protein
MDGGVGKYFFPLKITSDERRSEKIRNFRLERKFHGGLPESISG